MASCGDPGRSGIGRRAPAGASRDSWQRRPVAPIMLLAQSEKPQGFGDRVPKSAPDVQRRCARGPEEPDDLVPRIEYGVAGFPLLSALQLLSSVPRALDRRETLGERASAPTVGLP